EVPPSGPPPGVAGGTPGAPGGGGAPSKIKEVMGKLTKGPNSLTPLIGNELNEAQPPWETIQSQTREYAQLAATLGQYDPPKGHKESWAKLASAYAESAADLDKAAQAKDK